jgi:hypothetical protein
MSSIFKSESSLHKAQVIQTVLESAIRMGIHEPADSLINDASYESSCCHPGSYTTAMSRFPFIPAVAVTLALTRP